MNLQTLWHGSCCRLASHYIIDLIKTYIISNHDKEASYRRNIWDYSLLPGLSQALHNTPWQYSLLASFLLIFLSVYLITGNEVFLRLLEANFALLVGSMLKIDWNKKSEQKGEDPRV